jgi:hypothetical protein
VLPDPDGQRAAEVERHLEMLALRRKSRGAHPESDASKPPAAAWFPGTARVADACFNGTSAGRFADGSLDPRLVARFVEATEQPDRWLVIALAAITRIEVVRGLADEKHIARLDSIPVDDTTSSAADEADLFGEDASPHEAWSIKNLLQTLSLDAPDPKRILRAIEVAEDAAAHTPRARRQGVLALLAWLWWMRGMQSVSQRIVRDSLAIDLSHELTRMVGELNSEPPAFHLVRIQKAMQAAA